MVEAQGECVWKLAKPLKSGLIGTFAHILLSKLTHKTWPHVNSEQVVNRGKN
jgi:hypothetical protein